MKTKSVKFVPTTAVNGRDKDPAHHFFASSIASWRVSYDLEQLIKAMKKEPYPFNVYLVPGSKDTDYGIGNYAPQVDGAICLAFYAVE